MRIFRLIDLLLAWLSVCLYVSVSNALTKRRFSSILTSVLSGWAASAVVNAHWLKAHLDFGFMNFINVADCRIRHRIRMFTQMQPSLIAISGTCLAIVIMIIVVMINNFIDCAFYCMFLLTAFSILLFTFSGEFRHEKIIVYYVIGIAYVINFFLLAWLFFF